jgi:hypothetical protein
MKHPATSTLLHCHMITTQRPEIEAEALPIPLNLKFRNAAQKLIYLFYSK